MIKKILLTIVGLFFISSCQAKEVFIPENTNICLKVKRITQSKSISNSYKIKAEIVAPIAVADVTVFSVGNKAFLEVEDFKKAKGFGKSGYIIINGGIVYDNNQHPHKVLINRSFCEENDPWFIRWIPFNKGRQAIIYPSERFNTKLSTSIKYKQNENNNNHSDKNTDKKNNTVIQFGIINKN